MSNTAKHGTVSTSTLSSMGYNTTVVILNDALGAIAEDPGFGARLADAIRLAARGQQVSVAACSERCIYSGAATVIESHHADHDVLVRVGGNRGEVVS